MLFNSWGYLVFLCCIFFCYWALPKQNARIALIAVASVGFYAMWRWDFALLVIFSAVVDFVAARMIHRSEVAATRRLWLITSLTINLGLLFFFKYTYFAYENISSIADWFSAPLPPWESLGFNIILPLGISFYTFQTISYTIDVYRRTAEPVDSFTLFLAYVMFWPQLVAGPILRAGEVIPELTDHKKISLDDVGTGLQRILQGLFKKVVLADSLAIVVDDIFSGTISGFTAIDVWVAAFLFGFQIYFDFAGYSDMAIGSARLLGIRFPENFNWPYISKSPKEFWGRWHISLGSWIRDYLYLPLTGQRFQTESVGGLREATVDHASADKALLMTWLIMGLWHGAAWTFALWGVFHGISVLLYRRVPMLRKLPERLPWLAVLIMLAIAMISWIPFRARTLSDTFSMFGKVLNPMAYSIVGHQVTIYAYLFALVLTVAHFVAYGVQHNWPKLPMMLQSVFKVSAFAVMVSLIIVCMRPIQQFIYFQF